MSADGCVAGARATPDDVLAGRARWCVVEGDALALHPDHVRRLVRAGELVGYRLGRAVRVEVDSVRAYATRCPPRSAPGAARRRGPREVTPPSRPTAAPRVRRATRPPAPPAREIDPATVAEVEHLLWLQRRAWARELGLGADADLHAVPRGIA